MNAGDMVAEGAHRGHARTASELSAYCEGCQHTVTRALRSVKCEDSVAAFRWHGWSHRNAMFSQIVNKVPFRGDLFACAMSVSVNEKDETPARCSDQVYVAHGGRNQLAE